MPMNPFPLTSEMNFGLQTWNTQAYGYREMSELTGQALTLVPVIKIVTFTVIKMFHGPSEGENNVILSMLY